MALPATIAVTGSITFSEASAVAVSRATFQDINFRRKWLTAIVAILDLIQTGYLGVKGMNSLPWAAFLLVLYVAAAAFVCLPTVWWYRSSSDGHGGNLYFLSFRLESGFVWYGFATTKRP